MSNGNTDNTRDNDDNLIVDDAMMLGCMIFSAPFFLLVGVISLLVIFNVH